MATRRPQQHAPKPAEQASETGPAEEQAAPAPAPAPTVGDYPGLDADTVHRLYHKPPAGYVKPKFPSSI